MKKVFYLISGLLITGFVAHSQDSKQVSETPCYTKQWVDSVNTANLARFNSSAPNMFEWYVYDGQTEAVPQPHSIINVVKVKLEEDCPEQRIRK